MKLEDAVENLRESVMKDKCFFWEHPEIEFKEIQTSDYITKRLKEIGYKNIETQIAKTGIVATLEGKTKSPCILLRADMDAVLMDSTGRAKHTCGHDAHMSILLAVAKLLYDNKDKLKGTVKILFQPGEEGNGGGAKPMIEEGVLENPKVDKAFALHVWSEIPRGKIGIKEGAIMASTDPFDIEIIGKGGHAALPEKCKNPILVASKVIEEIKNINDKYNKSDKNVVLGITCIHSGNASNVIPDRATMKCVFRCYDNQIRNSIKQELCEMADRVSKDSDTQIKLHQIEERPVVINSKEEADEITKIATDLVGKENVVTDYKTMCSEDFSFFLEKVPGAFVFIGCMQEIYYPQHNENFYVDENSVMLGLQMFYNIAKKYLF